jgi:hypothetical protein
MSEKKDMHYGDLDKETKLKENKARHQLKLDGFRLIRQTRGGYMIINASTRAVVAGSNPAFGLSLFDVEVFAYTRREA